MSVGLTAHTFVTSEEFRDYLARTYKSEENIDDRVARALNGAVAWMENFTARRLKARNYRPQVTLTGFTLVSSSDSDTSASRSAGGLSTQIKAGDGVFGSVCPFGQQVVSLSDTLVSCTRPFESDLFTGSKTLTFGSRYEYVSGTGKGWLMLPEWPIKNLWAADYTYPLENTWTAMRVEDMRIVGQTARVESASEEFPAGTGNVRLQYRAGYEEPTNATLGDEEWHVLKRAQLRVAEILFGDDRTLQGRYSSVQVGTASTSFNDFSMPADVLGWLRPLRRFL